MEYQDIIDELDQLINSATAVFGRGSRTTDEIKRCFQIATAEAKEFSEYDEQEKGIHA